ncbi:protein kinase [Nocardia sp. NPDC005978]|uniref:protein kinase domain-containing protein n=1 Tax=Nocardia sp. NPDC005978 TaxID=3156725 RepID=UPI0033AF838A
MGRVLAQGQVFAGYRIERLIGAGGMGEVYLAHDRDLPRMIALKVLGPAVSDDADVRSRFLREADTVARLSHPNIVAVFARGEEAGQLWMAMQYVDGTDLSAVLSGGPVPPARAVRIVTEVAKALDRAHASGVLHRDVKPANILLASGTGAEVFLADFGIAKVLDHVGEATRTGQLYASLRYAAPEQFEARTAVSARTDVYALGGTLYHLLTGNPPYAGESPGQLLHGHLNLPVPQPTSSRSELPGGFDTVVTTALAKDPEHRFASCGELAAAAQQALAGLPIAGVPDATPRPAADADNAAMTTTVLPRVGAELVAAHVFSGGGSRWPADAPTERADVSAPAEPPSAPPANPSRRRGILARTALVLGWLALVIGVTGIVLHYTSWRSEYVVLAASFASFFMLGSVVAVALFLAARQWRTAAGAAAAVAAALWTQFPMLVPDGTAPPGIDVTVMQSNILFGHADADAIVREVRENGVEVLTLAELTPEALARLQAAGLETELPYYYVEPAAGGQGSGVYSRYPLQDASRLPRFSLHSIRATMLHPERGPITVFQFHPVPPNLNYPAWQAEMRELRDVLDQQPGKVIVGGDFNATYDHTAFRDLLRGRYADAAELVGVGAMPTWPDNQAWGRFPLIGIDRVLVADGHATEVHSVSIPETDHRAVIAKLRL